MMHTDEFKDIQDQMGMTNKELAGWLGCSESSITKMRSGEMRIRPQVARLLRLQSASRGMIAAVDDAHYRNVAIPQPIEDAFRRLKMEAEYRAS